MNPLTPTATQESGAKADQLDLEALTALLAARLQTDSQDRFFDERGESHGS